MNGSSMAKKSVLVVGSSNTDMIIKVERLPKPGETILGGEFSSNPGGKGANQATSAARAGGEVTFIARIGQDVFGQKALDGFISDGINVNYVVRDQANPSGVALIFVDKNGENSIAVASGANKELIPGDLKIAKNVFRETDIVVLQLETPLETVQAAIEMAFQNNKKVILNPAPAQLLPSSLLKQIYLLTPNETEAELLTGIKVSDEASVARAAEKLISLGVRNVIITMGSRGVFVMGDSVRQLIAGYKIKAVDTTAAGDVFNGALAVAIAEEKTLLDAVHFANAAAAISVTRLGAQSSAPTRKEIEHCINTGEIGETISNRDLSIREEDRNGWADHLSVVAGRI